MPSDAIPVAVNGFTWTAAGVWTLVVTVLGGALVAWIKGMPDRKKADVTDKQSEEAAIAAQWVRFQGEIDRLLARIGKLENRVDQLETELDESRAREAAAVSELAKLRAVNAGQGQVRQEAAVMVAAERVVEQKRAAG